jgi:hypothetical protein
MSVMPRWKREAVAAVRMEESVNNRRRSGLAECGGSAKNTRIVPVAETIQSNQIIPDTAGRNTGTSPGLSQLPTLHPSVNNTRSI